MWRQHGGAWDLHPVDDCGGPARQTAGVKGRVVEVGDALGDERDAEATHERHRSVWCHPLFCWYDRLYWCNRTNPHCACRCKWVMFLFRWSV